MRMWLTSPPPLVSYRGELGAVFKLSSVPSPKQQTRAQCHTTCCTSQRPVSLWPAAHLSLAIHQRLRSTEMRCYFCMRKLTGLFLFSLCCCLWAVAANAATPLNKKHPQSFHSSSTAGLPAALADGLHVYLGVRLLFVGHVIDWFVISFGWNI